MDELLLDPWVDRRGRRAVEIDFHSRGLTTLPRLLSGDDARLAALEEDIADGETIRFWECPFPAVVLGASGRLRDEADVEACSRAGVPIWRRSSGGGTVVIGPGCLNFALVLSLEQRPALRDIPRSYAIILGRIASTLGVDGISICGSDLALDGRKFSGNAQRRTRHAMLHHGTILYDFDLDLISRFLPEPTRQPPYRAGRPHEAFVCNLPLPAAEIRSRLQQAVCHHNSRI